MLLDTDSNKLQILLSGPIAAAPVEVTVEYEDTLREALTYKTLFTDVTSGIPTDVLEPPAPFTARRIIEMHITNADIASNQVEVIMTKNGVARSIQNVPLSPGDTLHYNRFDGWSINVAGPGGRGPFMKVARSVSANTAVTLQDDIIYVNAASGPITITFNPAIVTAGYAGFAKEVEIVKIDATANVISLFDGTDIIDIISTPVNSEGANGGSKFMSCLQGSSVIRTWGVG
jgi:hypothetical protein